MRRGTARDKAGRLRAQRLASRSPRVGGLCPPGDAFVMLAAIRPAADLSLPTVIANSRAFAKVA